jgi:hypothetical protein
VWPSVSELLPLLEDVPGEGLEEGSRVIKPQANTQLCPGRVQFLYRLGEDGRPIVVNINNPTDQKHWGFAMVEYLHHRNASMEWVADIVKDTGVVFWSKVEETYGIRLVTSSGAPSFTADRLAACRDDPRLAAHPRSVSSGDRKPCLPPPTKGEGAEIQPV